MRYLEKEQTHFECGFISLFSVMNKEHDFVYIICVVLNLYHCTPFFLTLIYFLIFLQFLYLILQNITFSVIKCCLFVNIPYFSLFYTSEDSASWKSMCTLNMQKDSVRGKICVNLLSDSWMGNRLACLTEANYTIGKTTRWDLLTVGNLLLERCMCELNCAWMIENVLYIKCS